MRSAPLSAVLAALLGAPAAADAPAVVTDIPVVHSLVAQVMGDRGDPVLLLDRGGDPHAFQMRPSQARALASADLVVWVGPQMTPWLDRALAGTGSAGARLTLLEVPGTRLRSYDAADGHDHDGHDHDHAGGEAEGTADGHDHDGHDHGHAHTGIDPHAWLDPANAAVWLGAIAAALAAADPEGAAAYAANAEAAVAALDTLDAEMRALLAPAAGRPLVVFHDAYGYLAEAYGLTIAGTLTAGDAASPGAGGVSALRARVLAGEIACVFAEANHSPDLVAVLVEGTQTPTGMLDPAGTMREPGPDHYAGTLRGLAEGIAGCLADAG